MACKADSSWGYSDCRVAKVNDCIIWMDLVAIRKKYNEVRDKFHNDYKIDLKLPDGRDKYGDNNHGEEIEQLATINGFISIKLTAGTSPSFSETRFIISSGSINQRLPTPSSGYTYDTTYGDWIVYLKSECYGCGGWKFDETGDHYARYRCCGGSCGDIDPTDWKSQDYVGKTVESGICNFGRDWGSNYMDVINSCIGLSYPKLNCICDITPLPPCENTQLECCQVDVKWYYSNDSDGYGDPNCYPIPGTCSYKEARGIKWIGSHEPSSGYTGYVTQVIKAQHLNDIKTAIAPAFGGANRAGKWNYCKDSNKSWNYNSTVDYDNYRTRAFLICKKCNEPAAGDPICACQMNDLIQVLCDMLKDNCKCHDYGGTAPKRSTEWANKTMWPVVSTAPGGSPTLDQCDCYKPTCEDLFNDYNGSAWYDDSITSHKTALDGKTQDWECEFTIDSGEPDPYKTPVDDPLPEWNDLRFFEKNKKYNNEKDAIITCKTHRTKPTPTDCQIAIAAGKVNLSTSNWMWWGGGGSFSSGDCTQVPWSGSTSGPTYYDHYKLCAYEIKETITAKNGGGSGKVKCKAKKTADEVKSTQEWYECVYMNAKPPCASETPYSPGTLTAKKCASSDVSSVNTNSYTIQGNYINIGSIENQFVV